jgi:hypothetical protein
MTESHDHHVQPVPAIVSPTLLATADQPNTAEELQVNFPQDSEENTLKD